MMTIEDFWLTMLGIIFIDCIRLWGNSFKKEVVEKYPSLKGTKRLNKLSVLHDVSYFFNLILWLILYFSLGNILERKYMAGCLAGAIIVGELLGTIVMKIFLSKERKRRYQLDTKF